MRKMYEIGWLLGCKYAEDYIELCDLTNIYFKKPVDIGCRLALKAQVTYVEKNRLVITV
jgi:acyl-CoA hydrolase